MLLRERKRGRGENERARHVEVEKNNLFTFRSFFLGCEDHLIGFGSPRPFSEGQQSSTTMDDCEGDADSDIEKETSASFDRSI